MCLHCNISVAISAQVPIALGVTSLLLVAIARCSEKGRQNKGLFLVAIARGAEDSKESVSSLFLVAIARCAEKAGKQRKNANGEHEVSQVRSFLLERSRRLRFCPPETCEYLYCVPQL